MFFTPLVSDRPVRGGGAGAGRRRLPDDDPVRNIDWTDYEIAIPAFLTIVLMPFTYSITNGIGAGLHLATSSSRPCGARRSEIHPLLWAVAVLFLLYFLRGELERLLF